MKKTLLSITLFITVTVAFGQDIKSLEPSYVNTLDFSEERKAEWVLRDTLLSQLYTGRKSWEEMTSEEQSVVNKFDETRTDIWDIKGGGCSWYCGGGPKEVTASSYLEAQGKNTYVPENAHDFSYKNAWVEGVPGYGIGEYLTYVFAPTSPRITEIIVVNGYVKSQSAWKNNSRVKKLKMYVNDKPYAILNLGDKIAEQGFQVKPIGNNQRDNWDVLKAQPDWTVKFEILEVYKGEKYKDVVISEIYFNGIDVH